MGGPMAAVLWGGAHMNLSLQSRHSLAASRSCFNTANFPTPGQPKTGGVLHVGQIGDLPSIDGHNSGVLQNDTACCSMTTTFRIQPVLAEFCDPSSDPRRTHLNLPRTSISTLAAASPTMT